MKRGVRLAILITVFTLTPAYVYAQAGYTFIPGSFQCSPSSCQQSLPYTVQGTARVDFQASCQFFGEPFLEMSGFAEAIVGIGGACQDPYQPVAIIETGTTILLDDCGLPYDLDHADAHGEIYAVGGELVWHKSYTQACDGSYSAPVVFGAQPC